MGQSSVSTESSQGSWQGGGVLIRFEFAWNDFCGGRDFKAYVRTAKLELQPLIRLRKNSHHVIPKGGVRPRNLLFLESRAEKQIPRFARDDKKYFFRSQ
jgi:hypothetical protein